MIENLKTGFRWGLLYAVGFTVLAVIVGVVRGVGGGLADWSEASRALAFVAGAYFAAGIVSGGLVGLLLPIGRSRAGAAVLGFIGGIPVYGIVGMAATPPHTWWPGLLIITLIAATVVGAPLGLLIWRDEQNGFDGR